MYVCDEKKEDILDTSWLLPSSQPETRRKCFIQFIELFIIWYVDGGLHH